MGRNIFFGKKLNIFWEEIRICNFWTRTRKKCLKMAVWLVNTNVLLKRVFEKSQILYFGSKYTFFGKILIFSERQYEYTMSWHVTEKSVKKWQFYERTQLNAKKSFWKKPILKFWASVYFVWKNLNIFWETVWIYNVMARNRKKC